VIPVWFTGLGDRIQVRRDTAMNKSSAWNGAANTALVVVSVVIALLLSELVVRVMPVGEQFEWQVPEAIPQRVERYSSISHPGELIMAAFGDSFVEYYRDSNRNFVNIAAKRMQQLSGKKVRVLNFGVAGTGLGNYRENFSYVASRLKFDIALFAVYSGNDFLDYWVSILKERRSAQMKKLEIASKRDLKSHFGIAPSLAWLKRSVLLNWLWRYVVKYEFGFGKTGFLQSNLQQLSLLFGENEQTMLDKVARLPNGYGKLAEADVINPWLVAWATARPDVMRMNRLGFGSDHEEVQRRITNELGRITTLCARHKVRCVFVFIPPSESVNERYHGFYRDLGYVLDSRVIGESVYERSAVKFLGGRGIPSLSLWPALAKQKDDIFLEHDLHFNLKGNEMAGLALGDWLANIAGKP